jgi:alpha-galactosidase
LYGTVAQDKSEGIFSYMQLSSNNNFGPHRATFAGLDSARRYRISAVETLSSPGFLQKAAPGWWPSVELTGAQLANIGLALPVLIPDTGILFHITSL